MRKVLVGLLALTISVAFPPGMGRCSMAVNGAPLTLEDFVQIREIDSVTPSPDGSKIAFRVLTPSLATNSTTAQWFLITLAPGSVPMPFGPPSDPIYIPEFDSILAGKLQWSKNSASGYALLDRGSQQQVYRLGPGPHFSQVTHDSADVEDFQLTPDGTSLTIEVRNPVASIQRARKLEDATGVHFDRTVFGEGLRLTDNFDANGRPTTVRRQPPPTVDWGVEAFRGDLRTKQVSLRLSPDGSEARKGRSPAMQRILDPNAKDARSQSISWRSGGSIRLVDDVSAPHGGLLVAVHTLDGRTITCQADICRRPAADIDGVSVLEDTGEVIITSGQHATGRRGIYGWMPESGKVRVILPPAGTLTGGHDFGEGPCPEVGHALVCVQEAATVPPRLVQIDLESGTVRPLSEPNRIVAEKHFPSVRFLEWKDARGRASSGYLMLPDNLPRPAPLVITTYTCHGLLRGGTAMAVPEPLLVERGIAALCVSYNDDMDVPDRDAQGRIVPASQVKGEVAAYDAIINQLASDNLIDRRRVGVTGQSLSSNVAAYAVSHTNLFAAAMIVGTTFDPFSHLITAPTIDNWREAPFSIQGLPDPRDDPRHIYDDVSPALNASKIHAAILFQPAESEWLFTLQLYSAIQHAGGVADMYIYPHTGHDPNRLPSDHYWRNRRTLDWFEYWLSGGHSSGSLDLANYQSWEAGRIGESALPLPSSAGPAM